MDYQSSQGATTSFVVRALGAERRGRGPRGGAGTPSARAPAGCPCGRGRTANTVSPVAPESACYVPCVIDGVEADAFQRFSRAFSGSRWRPYYVRWERQWRLRLDHLWLARAEVEVHNRNQAFVRLFLTSASGGRRASPLAESGFAALRAELERSGYELRHGARVPTTLFLKRFRATGPRLAEAHREVEERLSGMARTRRRNERSEGGISGAMRQFVRAPGWTPSSCGWSHRLRLKNGIGVVLAILLMKGAKGRRLHPEACVLLDSPEATPREPVKRLASLIRTAGYRGKLDMARPAGQKPFLFGHFWKDRFGPGGPTAERRHLDELAAVLRQLDSDHPRPRLRRGA